MVSTHALAQATPVQAIAASRLIKNTCSFSVEMGDEQKGDGDALNNDEIVVGDACCCFYDGFVTEGCMGCMGSSTVLCYEMEFCCKGGAPSLVPCYCFGCRCTSPTTCIKQQGQCCCMAGATAIPCDDEVPCMVGLCCVICYPKAGCAQKLGAIRGEGGGEGGEAVGGA